MDDYQVRGVLAQIDRDGKLSIVAAICGFSIDRLQRFIDGRKIAPKEVQVIRHALHSLSLKPEPQK